MSFNRLSKNPIRRLCGKEETVKEAETLLSLAKAKTSAGSGLSLGSSTVGLPAICAFLASERLGNNDVAEKVAQEAACLDPKRFKAALSTVRSALAAHLQDRKHRNISYHKLCERYGIHDNATRLMQKVEVELRSGDYLSSVKTSRETILCAVFYWTCIKMNIRAVKSRTLASDFELDFREFQDVEEIIEESCQGLSDDIETFLKDTKEGRKTPTKQQAILRTPQKQVPGLIAGLSPSKRKLPLPGETSILSEKRPRVGSPTKLNRIPITPAKPARSATAVVSTPTNTTPLRTYGSNRSFRTSNSKAGPSSQPDSETIQDHSNERKVLAREDELSKRLESEDEVADQIPTTPTKRTSSRIIAPQENALTGHLESHDETYEAVTPTPKRTTRTATVSSPKSDLSVRKGARSTKGSPLKTKFVAQETESISPIPEETMKPCRHRIPVFADRQFYLYRDPRKQREWDICEKNMQAMINMYGNPFAEASA